MDSHAPVIETVALTKIFRPPLSGVHRWLGRPVRDVVAVREVTLRIEAGEIFGLAGRNGQGKTTLIKLLATLIRPTAGTARVMGDDVLDRPEAARRRIGLVTSEERSFYYRLTGRQNLMFFARLHGLTDRAARARIGELARLLDAEETLERRYQELSSGNRQRLALARALLADPPLLLLDEPTRSLDPLAAAALRRLIREGLHRDQGKTILITSHNLQELEDLCGRVGILHGGRLCMCAPMDELRRRYADRERVRLRVRRIDGHADFPPALPDLDELCVARLEEGRWEVSFARRAGDDRLDLVIDRLRAAGGRIEACDTQHAGLMELMAALET